MLKIFLWFKYLCKKKIVFLSITAVSLCCALLIVVSSLFNGFINAFEKSAVEAVGDIVLNPPQRIWNYPVLIEKLKRLDSIKAASASLSGQGLLHLGSGNVKGVKMLGIDPVSQSEVTGFKPSLLRQGKITGKPSFEFIDSSEKIGGFVGIGVIEGPNELTDEYDLALAEGMIGRQVMLTTGSVDSGNQTAASITRRPIAFTITDIVYSGVYDLDKVYVYLPIEELQKKIYPNDKPHAADQIEIKLKEGVEPNEAKMQIAGAWVDFAQMQLGWGEYLISTTEIQTAQEMQSQYIGEIKKQLGILMVIFGIISCSVIALVFCIFYMIVMTCRKDIAVITSCGARSSTIGMIFVGFGGFVGGLGSGAGISFGYIITLNINPIERWISEQFGLKLWKSSTYMFSKIPNQVDWHSVWPIVLFAIGASAIGALLPAIIAARTKPVDILRYE